MNIYIFLYNRKVSIQKQEKKHRDNIAVITDIIDIGIGIVKRIDKLIDDM